MTKIDKTRLVTAGTTWEDLVFDSRKTMKKQIDALYRMQKQYIHKKELLDLPYKEWNNATKAFSVLIDTLYDNLEKYPEE